MTERNDSILVVVDVQERMMPVIDRSDAVTDAVLRLVRGFRALDLPILVTEQYSKGLGHTVPSVREALAEWYRPIEKITFSAAGELHFMQQLEGAARNHAIICGVELTSVEMVLFDLMQRADIAEFKAVSAIVK